LIIIIIIKPLDRRWVVVPSILLDHWLCPMRHQRRVLCRFPVVASTDGEADHVDVSIAACCVVDAWNKQISANWYAFFASWVVRQVYKLVCDGRFLSAFFCHYWSIVCNEWVGADADRIITTSCLLPKPKYVVNNAVINIVHILV